MCIYGLNSHWKCSFKNILQQKQENISLRSPSFVRRARSVYQSASIPRNLVCPQKFPGCAPVTFNLTFHPNFHPNIWLFANLPIYSKLIHDNINLVFWKPTIFCLVLFWRRYKIVCTYKHLHYKLWLVLFWRRYVLFLVINIGIMISVSVILKKIKFIVILIYLHCCNIPKGYSSKFQYVNIVEITTTQHYTSTV